mgnify:CR=1 FL=1
MTIRISCARSLLIVLLAAGGVRALALCELSAPLFVLAACAVVAIAAQALLSARLVSLALDDDGHWHALLSNGERFAGRLAAAGYRGAALVVLVLEEDSSMARARRRRVAVFADGVDARDFSFLHLQLAIVGGDR